MILLLLLLVMIIKYCSFVWRYFFQNFLHQFLLQLSGTEFTWYFFILCWHFVNLFSIIYKRWYTKIGHRTQIKTLLPTLALILYCNLLHFCLTLFPNFVVWEITYLVILRTLLLLYLNVLGIPCFFFMQNRQFLLFLGFSLAPKLLLPLECPVPCHLA